MQGLQKDPVGNFTDILVWHDVMLANLHIDTLAHIAWLGYVVDNTVVPEEAAAGRTE
jgi:hypothetical protein